MGRADRKGRNQKRRAGWAGPLAVLAAICLLGPGGPGAGAADGGDAADGIDYARNGSYKVRGVLNGSDLGIGLYDAGSMRLLPESRLLVAILNKQTGESWLYDRSSNATEAVSQERVALFDNFMPASYLEPYFQLEAYWSGQEFRMTTDDGRTFRVLMDGPGSLPTLFEVSNRKGVFQRMEWTYFKVGEVSGKNFLPPEGTVAP